MGEVFGSHLALHFVANRNRASYLSEIPHRLAFSLTQLLSNGNIKRAAMRDIIHDLYTRNMIKEWYETSGYTENGIIFFLRKFGYYLTI
jgi:hypothetical protein